MAQFSYKGVDRQGKRLQGKMDVANEGDLRMALRAQGIRPTLITKAGALEKDLFSMFNSGQGASVPVQHTVLFTRQLQLLISSGIPLVQALEVLGEQSSHKQLQTIVGVIREKVSSGAYLWEAMSHYPNVFPKLYVALMRAGEASGAMESMLKRLSKYLEEEERLRRMIKSAMMYPIFVVLIGAGVITAMMIFVIPKFEEMLKSNNQQLPWITQAVINASHFTSHNILYLIGGAMFGVWALKKYTSTPEGRAVKDRLIFRSPVFGQLAQKSGIARFCRTLQTLLVAGVNLIDAIDICKGAADNAVIEEAIGTIRGQVEGGKTLGMILGKLPIFPRMSAQMIMVGESTGNLDKSLEKIADFYESDVEVLVGGMSKLIEPFVLVVLGGAVGGMMIAMYLPIFQLAGGV